MKEYSLDTSLMDTSIRPGDDFFRFVNGKWLDQTVIPDDRDRWGSFDELRLKTDHKTISIVDRILDGSIKTEDPDAAKAIALVNSAMDLDMIESVGLQDIEGVIHEISGISNLEGLKQFIANNYTKGVTGLLSTGVFADLMQSDTNALYISGPSLGLPERDYYLNETEDSIKIRKDYVSYIQDLKRLDPSLGQIDGESILDFERKLAITLLSKEQGRNPTNIYHPHTIQQLEDTSKHIPWKRLFEGLDLVQSKLILTEVKYYEQLDTMLQEADIETVKQYLLFNVVNASCPYLSEKFDSVHFGFYGKRLGGAKTMKPRKERVLQVVNTVLGEAIGKLYVNEFFPSEAKKQAAEMVDLIKEAFRNRIKALPWMEAETKQKALKKLDAFGVKIAYPDKWKSYDGLSLGQGRAQSYAASMLQYAQWHHAIEMKKVGKEVDKSEWHMAPQVVNAYYSPLNNEIVFPAAILQRPFYDYQADPAINFGGIGAVIAHEMSHGFDDQGRRFDYEGNMIEWWSSEDLKQFEVLNQRMVEQADQFEILDGLTLNGEYTLGENLADLGGVLIAYDALKLYFSKHSKPGLIDGFTQEQRFFISWATVWRGKTRGDALRKQIATDPHPPFEFRASNPLSNVDAFYETWNVDAEQKMYRAPQERARVW